MTPSIDYAKIPEIKTHLEKLCEEKAAIKAAEGEETKIDSSKIDTLISLNIFKAIDFVLISEFLIIDKMKALIKVITYIFISMIFE